ncbi:MAG: LysR family transcriptional regulator [Proteobacteria bacterium]|nr:LysR family transcriptional regulator [Pseudomonadota bacterium]MBU1743092.1 LysR family transcriptional regulator [Pseudomonadota bacterium]
MEIRQLKTFQTVATLLNFNRAARRLHYAQSTVSAQIKALEDDLGVRLFDRLGKRVLLTEAGEKLLPFARKMCDLAEETRGEVGAAPEARGSLCVRIPESLGAYVMPAVLKRFQSRFPEVGLQFITCAYDGLARDLRQGVTDLAFLLAESMQAADLKVEVLGFQDLVLVAPPNHPLVGPGEVATRDLAGRTWLLSRVDCSYRMTFQALLAGEGVSPGVIIEFNSVAAIKQCVEAGVGLSVLPEWAVARERAEGRLAVLPWDGGRIEVATLMVWHRDKWLSPTLSAFMAVVREVMIDGGG